MPPRTPASADRRFTPPRSIARVLQVIKALARSARPTSLAELSVALGVPKTSLYAILKGLEQLGYVTFERDAYSLGPQAHALGQAISQGPSFPGCAMPVLERLAEASHETIILGALAEDRRHVRYAAVIEAESWLRFSVKVGTLRPLNASASGHAILSYLPPAERGRYLASGPFQRFTPRTVATQAGLRKAIATVRREHCAMTIDGSVDAAIGIAAPYFGRSGAVEGALVIAAPTTRIFDRQTEIKAAVIKGAEALSRILEYTGPYPP